MTDLTKAIAELRRGPHWPGAIPWKDVQNMICNAALSGDLVPRAEADLAVALMVEKTADSVAGWSLAASEEIEVLAPASALAELQALRDEVIAAHADITSYQEIVADMTQEAETDKAELATLRAQVERLTGAAQALGAMPEGYCFCSRNRIGDDSKTHEPECADLRAALTEGAAP